MLTYKIIPSEKLTSSTATVALIFAAGVGHAANVSPDIIFGTGVANGGFTVSTGTYDLTVGDDIPLEIALRAKLRFNESNIAENTFNYDGVDTYTFDAGLPPSGFSFASGSPGTAIWNFEWSVNTDAGDFDLPAPNATSLNALTYEIRIDGDATAGTDFLVFDPISIDLVSDPINQEFPDHAIGGNSTGNGDGAVATSATEYAMFLANNQVAQNSWNYEFFNDAGSPLENFRGDTVGQYRIEFEAFFGDTSVASTAINVISGPLNPVPVPASLPLLGGALLGLGLWMRRNKRA